MTNVNNRGFTLLEVMLAVSILAVVSSMVGFALNSTVDLLAATANQKDIYRQARITLDRMRSDLAAAVVDGEVGFVGTKNEINGRQAAGLIFSSMAHLAFDDGRSDKGSTTIAYEVIEDENDPGSFKLLRADTLSVFAEESGEKEAYTLCAGLRSLQLTYWDAEGQKNDSWASKPDEENEQEPVLLPAAVFITLEFWQDSEHKTVIPFRSGVWLPTGSIKEEQDGES
ncbi:prepilin-type N-terminal cleavage/methylation domain-containing protein [Desulfogranum marinum]|uniref:prepilin-type N-terminal cleavage/methylation domain-containing protein n=1 Tax=Desulfogranum marinum TaxID=453220 RepID=UPI001962AB11|nr:prepilin-type N-terminal cleavage/methylation domain-containing protein [Desulfogranum marinum]MBM9511098.1 prepilin-type N-terminal cleavage/methylation domain-containing protein [Desulfogranum marinum]